MQKRRSIRSFLPRGIALGVFAVATLAALPACKDTEARDQLKKAKTELEDREDELADAEKKLKGVSRDLEDAKSNLEAATKREADLREQLAKCTLTDASPPPPPLLPTSMGRQCTAYFKFMDDCLPQMPAAMQTPMRDSLDTMRKSMSSVGAFGMGAMETACKAALDAVVKIPQCSFLPKPCTCDPTDPLCSC